MILYLNYFYFQYNNKIDKYDTIWPTSINQFLLCMLLTSLSIGQVPVEFEFINKLEEQSYCQPWLKITPYKSVITPGNHQS